MSLLPDDAEIRLTRSRTSSIDIPMLEEDRVLATRTDSDVLNEMTFGDDGKFYTAGNVNRRKTASCRRASRSPCARCRSWSVRNQMLSPFREKRQNIFRSRVISNSKRSNFENRIEWMESRALERNGLSENK
jgi:hypothetical protein